MSFENWTRFLNDTLRRIRADKEEKARDGTSKTGSGGKDDDRGSKGSSQSI